jgi:hypothetical protein
LKKPDKCKDCPLYGNGDGFVPDKNSNARLTIALNHPCSEEAERGTSGIGGAWLDIAKNYLSYTGETDVNITHVLRCREWKVGKVIPWWLEKPIVSRVIKEAIKHCAKHDKDMGEDLIIAQGELGHYKYGNAAKDDAPYNWRGHLLPEDSNGNI